MLFRGPTSWVDVITIASGIVAIAVVAVPTWRKRIKPWMLRRKASRLALDQTLMGRPEIRDPADNRLLSEAVPPLGIRLGGIERALEKVSEALVAQAGTQELVLGLKAQVDRHEVEIDLLKRGQAERVATKLENAAAFVTIDKLMGDPGASHEDAPSSGNLPVKPED